MDHSGYICCRTQAAQFFKEDFHEFEERFAAVGVGEIEGDTFFVASGEYPAIVQFRFGSAGQMRKEAEEIAALGAFDFEYLGAKVRHHGGGGWAGDICAAVDHSDS